MLSVLIPTYNYNVFPLAEEIHSYLVSENISFEIICLDDGSNNKETITENQKINSLANSSFSRLKENIGRSSIRNLLAEKATYQWLMFLDADVFPKSKNFISSYLRHIKSENDLICGGIAYKQEKPAQKEVLRWKYGHKRESKPAKARKLVPYKSFLTANFLIQKKLFGKIRFNEQMKQYGHEDTLFAFNLMEHRAKILHIDNPVFHLGLETNEIFLKKSLTAVKGAYFLEKASLIDPNEIKILEVYNKLDRLKLLYIIAASGNIFKNKIKKNLLGSNPSLKLYDFYRLQYLYKIKNA